MAEFNLGRIRFVWKNTWTSGTVYYKDDVVRYGGKTYICQVNHTANASFDVDLNFVPSKWNVMSSGQDWRSDWTTGTVYKIGDIVKYGRRGSISFHLKVRGKQGHVAYPDLADNPITKLIDILSKLNQTS